MRLPRFVAVLAIVLSACGEGTSEPQPIVGALQFKDLTAGYFHTCGLTTAGVTYCWGHNVFGTVGDGTRIERTRPTRIFGGPVLVDIDAGAGHTCGLSIEGDAWCWGQNDEGQVGDGTFVPRDRPMKVLGGLKFKSVTAGHAHSCGVTTNDVAYCWGDDSKGQLGDSATGKFSQPVKVKTDKSFSIVIAGYYQTCGLTTNGQALCWGDNTSGQFDSKTYKQISAGDRFGCGISNGSVSCWGLNRNGEQAAPTSLNVVYTSRGTSTAGTDAYGCGLKSDRHAVCWGGSIRTVRSAGPASSLDDRFSFQQLALGSLHICGLTTGGYAYCGGSNGNGQLGIGSNTDSPTLQPVQGAVSN